jgi:predicted ATPase
MLTSEVRLLTLTGPPGTGKTRLALQAAAQLLRDRDFEDGVFFVNLAPITDPTLVISEIAQTLGVGESAGKSMLEGLEAYLKARQLLLVLDNFEQVAEAAPVVAELLMTAPGVKLLVSSRVPLHVRGEKEVAVSPLHLPDLQHLPPAASLSRYEAVRLFTERATDVNADFELSEDSAYAVAHVCTRLDGLPLAIELAAARVKVLSPEAILARLESRLELLTIGPRDLPARQRTLRSAIEWSYDLLDENEKMLFSRLGIFQGGRSLEAIEAVCNPEGMMPQMTGMSVLDGVSSLVDKGLLRPEEGTGGDPRFVMLETIHEFAREKLRESGKAEELARRHALYFMRLAEEAEPYLTGKQQLKWLNRLDDERDNIRAALRWARSDDGSGDIFGVEVGLRLCGAIWRFWSVRGYFSEGREQLRTLLADPRASADELRAYKAKALNGMSKLAFRQGDTAFAHALDEESLAIHRELGDRPGIALTLLHLGNLTIRQGDLDSARRLYEESLAVYRELEDRWGIGASLGNLGIVAFLHGDYTSARMQYEEALANDREEGNANGMAFGQLNLGNLALKQGDFASAHANFRESLLLLAELEDRWAIAVGLAALGEVAVGHAVSVWGEGSEGSEGTNSPESETGAALRALSREAKAKREMRSMGEGQRGLRLLGAARVLLDTIGGVLDAEDQPFYDQAIASAHRLLDDGQFEQAWREGRAMSMEQAIAYALAE